MSSLSVLLAYNEVKKPNKGNMIFIFFFLKFFASFNLLIYNKLQIQHFHSWNPLYMVSPQAYVKNFL